MLHFSGINFFLLKKGKILFTVVVAGQGKDPHPITVERTTFMCYVIIILMNFKVTINYEYTYSQAPNS